MQQVVENIANIHKQYETKELHDARCEKKFLQLKLEAKEKNDT